MCCGVLCLVWVGCICCVCSVYGVVRHDRVVWVVGVECHAIECGMCICTAIGCLMVCGCRVLNWVVCDVVCRSET